MGNCIGKIRNDIKNNKSVVKLTCPYCNSFETYNLKKYDKHICNCIELDRYFTVNVDY